MSAKAQAFIDKLLQIVASKDHSRMDELLGETITFHTPRFLKPHTDRKVVKLILQGIPMVIKNFHYERTWPAGDEAIMEFKGHVGRWVVHGLDIFTVGDDGRATELTVFVRPPKGLEALGEAEDKLAAFFGKPPAPTAAPA
ncbi:MAG: hypothetical protein IH627_03565 [Rubrivivax sp.]|nr:hypothetical protein [Rubrivivax sp.]